MPFVKAWRNWPALFVQHQYFELSHFCLPVSPVAKSALRNWQVSTDKQHLLADKLPTSKNIFDLNQKHFCLPTCKMCLPSMKCLKKLLVAKRTSKDMLLKLSHVRQTMLVSFARPLSIQTSLKMMSYYVCPWRVGSWVFFFSVRQCRNRLARVPGLTEICTYQRPKMTRKVVVTTSFGEKCAIHHMYFSRSKNDVCKRVPRKKEGPKGFKFEICIKSTQNLYQINSNIYISFYHIYFFVLIFLIRFFLFFSLCAKIGYGADCKRE